MKTENVFLNLLNKTRKIDKMRGLPSILTLFRMVFNEFNNTLLGLESMLFIELH